VTSPADWVPESVNTETPSACRIYDYLLGGSHNFAPDREAAERALSITPWIRPMARANRDFLRRVVTELTRAGVHQFLDLGSGVPTVGNVHDIAQAYEPRAKVVYVDLDPVAIATSQLMLVGEPNATVVPADIRHPARVRKHAGMGLLNFNRPIALLMISILPFVNDQDRPGELVCAYLDELPVGSYLVVSHASLDGAGPETRARVAEAELIYSRAGQGVTLREPDEITSWFEGLELMEPGVVPINTWRPDGADRFGDTPSEMPSFGGVGKVVR
jgi:hypothetical protein